MKNAIGNKRREENPKKLKRVNLIYPNTLLLSCSEDNLTQMPETRLELGVVWSSQSLWGIKQPAGEGCYPFPLHSGFSMTM